MSHRYDVTLTHAPACFNLEWPRYNKIFVDAFWNSKRQSFGKHIYRLMSSWALVCDVWFLEPQVSRRWALIAFLMWAL